jgi:hypothetical protein
MTDLPAHPPAAPTAAGDLLEHTWQLITDLLEVCQRLLIDLAEPEPVAQVMDRLAEECTEATAMIRALPGRPRDVPGYTATATATAAAVTAAAEAERDFGGWLAAICCQAAAHLGSAAALMAARPGWEAETVLTLVQGTCPDDQLSRYSGGAQ